MAATAADAAAAATVAVEAEAAAAAAAARASLHLKGIPVYSRFLSRFMWFPRRISQFTYFHVKREITGAVSTLHYKSKSCEPIFKN